MFLRICVSRPLIGIVSAVAILLWGIGCGHTKAGPTHLGLERVLTALEQSDLKIMDSDPLVHEGPVVVVIGENHASVSAQRGIASTLANLQGQGVLDAVLIEGSHGEIDVTAFREQFDAKSWKQDLEWGRISGFEYFVLTTAAPPALFGVEDMVAKQKFFYRSQLPRADAPLLIPTIDHAIDTIDEELRRLAGQAKADTLKSLEDRRTALLRHRERLSTSTAELSNKGQELGLDALLSEQARDSALLVEKQTSLSQDARSAATLVAQHQRALSSGDIATQRELTTRLERVLEELGPLKVLLDSIESRNREAERVLAKLQPSSKQLSEDVEAALDTLMLTLNELERVGERLGIDLPAVRTFFRDSAKIEREAGRASIRRQVAERDDAMVVNTQDYLGRHRPRVVALIVGSHHLANISERLALGSITHVVAEIGPNVPEIEPWEIEAWERRQNPGLRIYAGEEIKERTRLLDPSWKVDERKRRRLLRGLESREPVSVSRQGYRDYRIGSGHSNVAFHVSSMPFNRQAQYGDHVVDFGGVPGKPQQHYRVTKAEVAERYVRDLTDHEAMSVYFYPERRDGGRTTHRALVRKGGVVRDVAVVDELVAAIRQEGARNVVLFGEVDESGATGTTGSRVAQYLRRATGRSKHDEAGQSPAAIHQTLAPERARRNLHAIKQIDPTQLGPVNIVEGSLNRLQRTPSTSVGAQTIVIVAENTQAFRAQLKAAAQEKRFKGKLVVLLSCGNDPLIAAREQMLNGGALMVYTLDGQITPKTAQRAARTAAEIADEMGPNRPVDVRTLMDLSLERLQESGSLTEGDLAPLRKGSSWVEVDRERLNPPVACRPTHSPTSQCQSSTQTKGG